MLSTTPSFERIALNRVTFGARDTDVAAAQSMGWAAWVNEQLSPPAGDDPALDAHLKAQLLPISYKAGTENVGTWSAVSENRPLNYLYAKAEDLWNMATGVLEKSISQAEINRVVQELASGHFIRNTHAKYQIREVMVDFWHNHFNVSRDNEQHCTVMLPIYDRDVIRPNALGNFRAMLESVATSAAMLLFLDNAQSNKRQPNENYARELLELHTLGAESYLGVSSESGGQGLAIGTVAAGYTDQDVIEASRALSGWTLERGQRDQTGHVLPNTGKFVYNAAQHNTQAKTFLGLDLSGMTADMQQGRFVLDLAAYHPNTADFVCRKLAVRLFGDEPPETVVDRAKTAWMANQQTTDQIKKVLEAMLLGGDEVGAGPQAKIRRPYERVIALLRTTDTTVNASQTAPYSVSNMEDGLFVWPEPDGRPDNNNFWLSSVAMLGTWNILIQAPNSKDVVVDIAGQTPSSVMSSAALIAENWIDRMIGYQPGQAAYNGIVAYAASAGGVMGALKTGKANVIETAFRKLVSLIATSEEFAYR